MKVSCTLRIKPISTQSATMVVSVSDIALPQVKEADTLVNCYFPGGIDLVLEARARIVELLKSTWMMPHKLGGSIKRPLRVFSDHGELTGTIDSIEIDPAIISDDIIISASLDAAVLSKRIMSLLSFDFKTFFLEEGVEISFE